MLFLFFLEPARLVARCSAPLHRWLDPHPLSLPLPPPIHVHTRTRSPPFVHAPHSPCTCPSTAITTLRVQLRQFLFQLNRQSTKLQWNLNRVEYATRHLVTGADGHSHYETRWNVKYSVEVTLEGGPASLPPTAGTAAHPCLMPPDAIRDPGPPPGVVSPTAPAFVHGMGFAAGSPR